MAWQDEQPPWSGGKKSPSPEDFIADLLKKLKQSFGGGGRSDIPGEEGGEGPTGPSPGILGGVGKILIVIGIVILFQVAYSAFYTIKPGERGVVLRFGEYSKTAPPGLNFKLPLIDEVYKVDIETVRKEEFGFRTKIPARQTVYQKE